MTTENQIVVSQFPKASDQLAAFLGIEKGMMLDTLKVQCFKNKRPDEVSDAQLAAFVSTANVLQVNPLIPGMLFAYPERNGGITPILGPDGCFKKLDEFIASGKLTGFECEVVMVDGKPDHANAVIYRAGDQKPAKYTAYFSEWNVSSNPNWQTRPRHMLWVRAIKQAARQVIHGLPMDADEYQIAQMTNVTPEEAAPVVRPEPPKRAVRGAAKVKENVQEADVVPPAPAPEAPKVEASAPTPEPAKATVQADGIPAGVHGDAAEADAVIARHGTPQPRAFLNDGEELTTVCEVVSVTGKEETKGGAHVGYFAEAKLTGGFVGVAYHRGGATKQGDAITPSAPWSVGAKLTLTLRGKKSAKGVVNVFVEKVEAVGEVEEF